MYNSRLKFRLKIKQTNTCVKLTLFIFIGKGKYIIRIVKFAIKFYKDCRENHKNMIKIWWFLLEIPFLNKSLLTTANTGTKSSGIFFLSAEFHFFASKDFKTNFFRASCTREMAIILIKFKIYPILINPRSIVTFDLSF